MPEEAAICAGNSSLVVARLSHWVWAIPALLMVAALTLRQIDAYPPAADEFYSMFNTGYLAGRPYSPVEIVESLGRQSSDHMPGFFVLLGAWGHATSYTLPTARVLPILVGILALAMIYRLAKDYVTPLAGLIALVIAGSGAFYNFHYAYVRMYTLVMLLVAVLLWLYFKVVSGEEAPRRRDYAALGAAVASLILTHPFCVTMLTSLGLYHLLFVRKDRRWLSLTISVALAVVVISPYLLVWASSLGATLERKSLVGSPGMLDATGAVVAWLSVIVNDQPALLLGMIAGVALCIWKRYINLTPWLPLSLLFLGVLAAVAQFVPVINESTMRYHLVGWLPFVMLFSAALYSLYRLHPLLLCLVLLWPVAGMWRQSEIDDPGWTQRLGWQSHIYPLPPWHAVSREAQEAFPPPIVVAHVNMSFELRTTQHINYSQMYHYFDRHSAVFWQLDDLAWFDGLVNDLVISTPNLWVLYQLSTVLDQQVVDMRGAMMAKRYQLCESTALGEDSVLLQYSWRMLECRPPALRASYQTGFINYDFFGVKLDATAARFIDRWIAKTEFDQAQFSMSYQLLDEGWNNVAQLDLPLVHEGKFRQFSVGIADVPAGVYRLVAVMYDNQTGETSAWADNPGSAPGIIELSEIVIEE